MKHGYPINKVAKELQKNNKNEIEYYYNMW